MRIAPKYSPESQLCRVMMTLRSIDEVQLARLTGCSVGTVRNLLANSRDYLALRIKVEKLLHCRIWSTPAQFREHQRKQ